MPTVLCFCEKCGDRFYCKDELYSPPTRNMFKISNIKNVPRTWDEWLTHLSSHCEKCRLNDPPTSCLTDLNKLRGS